MHGPETMNVKIPTFLSVFPIFKVFCCLSGYFNLLVALNYCIPGGKKERRCPLEAMNVSTILSSYLANQNGLPTNWPINRQTSTNCLKKKQITLWIIWTIWSTSSSLSNRTIIGAQFEAYTCKNSCKFDVLVCWWSQYILEYVYFKISHIYYLCPCLSGAEFALCYSYLSWKVKNTIWPKNYRILFSFLQREK